VFYASVFSVFLRMFLVCFCVVLFFLSAVFCLFIYLSCSCMGHVAWIKLIELNWIELELFCTCRYKIQLLLKTRIEPLRNSTPAAKTAFNLFNLRSASPRIFGLLPNPQWGAFTIANIAMVKFLQKLPGFESRSGCQNLINWSLNYVQPFHKISQRFDQWFLSNPVNRQTERQTDRQTDTGESITSLTEVIKVVTDNADDDDSFPPIFSTIVC